MNEDQNGIKDQPCLKCGSYVWLNAREESGAIVECDQCDNGKVKWDQTEEGSYRTLTLNNVKFIEIQALDDLTDATNAMALDLNHFVNENSGQHHAVKSTKQARMYRRFYETLARWMLFKTQFYGEDMKAKLLGEEESVELKRPVDVVAEVVP